MGESLMKVEAQIFCTLKQSLKQLVRDIFLAIFKEILYYSEFFDGCYHIRR